MAWIIAESDVDHIYLQIKYTPYQQHGTITGEGEVRGHPHSDPGYDQGRHHTSLCRSRAQ
eukprot:12574017-Prorocentrum_lima.AAC.1